MRSSRVFLLIKYVFAQKEPKQLNRKYPMPDNQSNRSRHSEAQLVSVISAYEIKRFFTVKFLFFTVKSSLLINALTESECY